MTNQMEVLAVAKMPEDEEAAFLSQLWKVWAGPWRCASPDCANAIDDRGLSLRLALMGIRGEQAIRTLVVQLVCGPCTDRTNNAVGANP